MKNIRVYFHRLGKKYFLRALVQITPNQYLEINANMGGTRLLTIDLFLMKNTKHFIRMRLTMTSLLKINYCRL